MSVFDPEDFKEIFTGLPGVLEPYNTHKYWLYQHCENIIRERGVSVVGTQYPSEKGWSFDQQPLIPGETTHKALLINIEELPHKECEHDIDTAELFKTYGFLNAKCRHCGISVRAKWVVSE